jgi:hypothetical protein
LEFRRTRINGSSESVMRGAYFRLESQRLILRSSSVSQIKVTLSEYSVAQSE